MQMGKKGQAGIFASIPSGVIYLVVAVVALSMGALLLTNLSTSFTAGTAAANTTGYGQSALTSVSSYVPTLALIFVFVIVIGAIVGMLYFRK